MTGEGSSLPRRRPTPPENEGSLSPTARTLYVSSTIAAYSAGNPPLSNNKSSTDWNIISA